MEITKTQRGILQTLCDMQVINWANDNEEPQWHVNDDETPPATYKRLEEALGVDRSRLKPEMLELRNAQFVELTGAVDYEYYAPCGSGWMITKKGLEQALAIGITPTE